MRRKLTFLALAVVAMLHAAGIATAANGGFTPVTPHSPNASHTNTAYYVILGFTSAIFVIVEGALAIFVVKYRRRGRARTEEGLQVHGHTRLELIWTVIPVLILCAIGIVVFLELPSIKSAPAASDPLRVTVEGHQFYWQFDYPDGSRMINDLVVPVDRVVDLKVVSADVIHSWWIPELGGKIQAIPGRTNHIWFRANATGTYSGQCAELCGLYHADMTARVTAMSDAGYRTALASAPANLGKAEFTGVCATCHGMHGQGGYGPTISSSPLVAQKSTLVQILRHGLDTPRPGVMPAVGSTWTNAQIDALVAYVKKNVYKGAAPLGG
ncbi:MAG TPA: cytochrome c oxidase subunit II [Gaiellaceae bacterium]|nr:cytochrome c oxidase subunit II [Gaiellaceae bacterium]